jgi:4-amino-4-deoxy-L-arabinose transferase-like glycosyltransferase
MQTAIRIALEARTSSRRWWFATGALLVVRLFCAAGLPLGDDEGYHWVWSRHLAWSYFDHPPMMAWLVAASTALLGTSLMAIRLPFVLLGTLTAHQLRALVSEVTGNTSLADRGSLLFQIVPVFFGIGILVIPDAPLHFFWLLAARALWRRHWLAVGLALGAALLSKYVGVLLAISAAGYLIFTRQWRSLPGLAVACLLATAVFIPVLYWNAHHHWDSFRYQFFARHEGSGGPNLQRTALYLASQVLYLSPILAVLAAGAAMPRPRTEGERFLWWLAAPTLAIFLAASAVTSFKPNWPAPGYLTLMPLVFVGLDRSGKRAKPLGAATAAVAILFTALPIVQVTTALVPLPRGDDPVADMRGWREAAAATVRADSALRRDGGSPFYAAGRYQNAARLEFYLPGRPAVLCLNPGRDAFDDWQDLERLRGRDFVFLASSRFPDPPASADSATVFERVEIKAGERTLNSFTVYVCRGFRSPVTR